jgi:hypothetical protein
MNHRFLAKKGIEKFFNQSELSVGEILRAITQEKFTGLKCENRGVLLNKSDQEWYEVIEKAFDYEQE